MEYYIRKVHIREMENLNIQKLTPERLNDYLYFFENVAHTDNKGWDRCYCLNYCSDNNIELGEEFNNAETRRTYAIKYVTEGKIQGYLAYYNGQHVGWCNANDRNECMNCIGWKYLISTKSELNKEDNKIKSIFCFTVAPKMRGKHVATALMERVIRDAQKEGCDYVEAYPNKEEADMYYSYVGPMGLYKKYGFEECGETEQRLVLRKKL